jgi:hypothetical protein
LIDKASALTWNSIEATLFLSEVIVDEPPVRHGGFDLPDGLSHGTNAKQALDEHEPPDRYWMTVIFTVQVFHQIVDEAKVIRPANLAPGFCRQSGTTERGCPLLRFQHGLRETLEVVKMPIQNGFQDVEVQGLIFVHRGIAETDHLHHSPGQIFIQQAGILHQFERFPARFGNAQFALANDMHRNINALLACALNVQDDAVLFGEISKVFGVVFINFTNASDTTFY